MPSHVKVKGSTWNLNLKAVKKVVGRGYVRTSASWSLEKNKVILNGLYSNYATYKIIINLNMLSTSMKDRFRGQITTHKLSHQIIGI